MEFYRLTYDSEISNVDYVTNCDLGKINFSNFKKSNKLDEKLIFENLKIDITRNINILPDSLGNPLSIQLYSDRLLTEINKICANSIQTIKIPLWYSGDNYIEYNLVHVTEICDAIDLEKSDKISLGNLGFAIIKPAVLVDKIPKDIHIFRPTTDQKIILVDEIFLNHLMGKNFTGIALLKCKI